MITFPHGFLTTVGAAPSAFDNTYSVDFDGVNDYVNCGNSTELQLTGAITVSVWLKFTGTQKCAISKHKESGTKGWILWAMGYGALYPKFGICNGTTVYYSGTSGSRIDDDAWHHVVGVYVPSTSVSVYVDGVLSSQNTTSIPATMNNTDANVILGRFTEAFPYPYFFPGNMDEVGIWDVALDADAITALYNSGDPISLSSDSGDYDNSGDLQAWWRMGDGDTYPMLNNEQAYSNRSVDFDGVNDYVDIGSPSTGTGTHTISMWVNPTSIADDDRPISNIDNTNFGIRFYLGNVQIWGTGTAWATVFSNPSTAVWTHMAFVFDGSGNVTGYKNGVAGSTVSVNYTLSQLGLGARVGLAFGDEYHGKMDDVAIWNTALSSGNITTIYNNGTPNDISALSPVGYWKMGDGDTYPTLTDSGSGSNDGTMTNMVAGDITGAQTTGIMTNMAEADIEEDVPS